MGKLNFNTRDIQYYLDRLKDGQGYGLRGIALGYLASCSNAKHIDNPRDRDERIFFNLAKTLYDLLQGTAYFVDIQRRGAMFNKAVLECNPSVDHLANDHSMLGKSIIYMRHKNPGYGGLGQVIQEAGLKELEALRQVGISEVIRRGIIILSNRFSKF